jgi:hypothetical protein
MIEIYNKEEKLVLTSEKKEIVFNQSTKEVSLD